MKKYSMKQFTELTGLSRTTILYYEEKGLLTPDCSSTSGSRYYTVDDAAKILYFQNLKNLGISVSEYVDVLNSGDKESDIYDLVLRKKNEFTMRTMKLLNMWDETLSITYHLRSGKIRRYYADSRPMWFLPIEGNPSASDVMEQWGQYFLERNMAYVFTSDPSLPGPVRFQRGLSCYVSDSLSPPLEVTSKLVLLPSRYCMLSVLPLDMHSENFEALLGRMIGYAEEDGFRCEGKPWAHLGYRDEGASVPNYLTVYLPVSKKQESV